MKPCEEKPGLVAKLLKLLPIVLQLKFLLISAYCLYLYTWEVQVQDNLHAHYIMFTIMVLNNVVGFTKFFADESFCELRVLVDYAQLTMVLPLYATGFWVTYGSGAEDAAIVPAALGVAAFLFFVLMEYKRQDLSDLAILVSIIPVLLASCLVGNYMTITAIVTYLVVYYRKRKETCSAEAPPLYYNYLMAFFGLTVLADMGPAHWLPEKT